MKRATTLIIIFISCACFSQKMKIQQGNFDFLKGQEEINVEFVYDNMKLLKDNLSIDEYVKNHSAELEDK